MTMLSSTITMPPTEMWSQLKNENRDFAVKQIKRGAWDFAVDLARFSLANIQNISTNDVLIQEAIGQFNSVVTQIKDQILEAFNSNAKEYGHSILEDLNRHLGVVHQRLEAITRESAALNPALKESLASLNGTASAIGSLLTSLKLPSVKGELGETNALESMRTTFLGIPSVSMEPLGNAGDTDMIIRFEQNSMEIARVLVESKNRIAWSNSFLTQLQRDMDERKASFGILVTTALPKDAKTRGYTITEKTGIIIIATPELAPTVALILYELIHSLDRLSNRGQTLQTLLHSRELVDCLTNNLTLVEPLRGIIKIMDKAHADVSSSVNNITEAIQRNNAKLIESLPQSEVKSS